MADSSQDLAIYTDYSAHVPAAFPLSIDMLTTDPQDEIFDVVDEHNRVVGTATRAEVHQKGLRHRACHIIVFDEQSRVLVQQRSLTKDNSPGLWDSSSAGHVDSGETYEQCAVRELREELGLHCDAADLTECFLMPPEPFNGMEFAQVYRLQTAGAITPDSVEIAAIRWVTQAELSAWVERSGEDFTEVFRFIWKQLNKH